MDNTPVKMVLESLEDFPEYQLPGGFEFRDYKPGDCNTWVEIYSSAEYLAKDRITPELFAEQFYGNDEELAKRMFFIYKEDKVIGTSTAWYDDKGNDPKKGRVHWVAIHPEFRGQGLSKPLLSETLRRLKELGHNSSYLATSTGRTPAICLYLKYGFVPDPENGEQIEAWKDWGEENGISLDLNQK